MVEVAAFVAGWLTPTSLFVLLNIVIGTIFFTSSFGFGSNQNNKKQPETTTAQSYPQLFRAPSLFSRVTSFNFSSTSTTQHHHHYSTYHYSEPDETHFQARPDPNPQASLLSRVASFNFCRAQAQPVKEAAADEGKVGISSEEEVGDDQSRGVKREPEKADDDDEEEEEEREKEEKKKKKKEVVKQRKVGGKGKKTKAAGAATTTTKTVSLLDKSKSKTVSLLDKGREGEVDAKADDFINRFKQQLKMQRLESLLRYRTNSTN